MSQIVFPTFPHSQAKTLTEKQRRTVKQIFHYWNFY